MTKRRIPGLFSSWLRLCAVACLLATAHAAEHHGRVTFNGMPVPGATVTASQGSKKVVAVSDVAGIYSFPDLADGTWELEVGMSGFEIAKQQVAVAANAQPAAFELQMLPLQQMNAQQMKVDVGSSSSQPLIATTVPVETAPKPANAPQPPRPAEEQQKNSDDDMAQRAADGLLINGSSNNSADSPFARPAAFGNNRFGMRSAYSGSFGFIADNSALDARPYSLAGQLAPKSDYNLLTGFAYFGGPVKIPHTTGFPANFFVGYQWTRNSNAVTQSALVPTLTQRGGVFDSPIVNPATGKPFAGNAIPASSISPQAKALLALYPLPNVSGNSRYNFQVPILTPTHQDALQTRLSKNIGRNNRVFGSFNFQSTRASSPNLFGFVDTSSALGFNADLNWTHRINNNWFLNAGYQFSRYAEHVTPFFAGRQNVSADAGIAGNDQDPRNWGPPALTFTSGIASLSDQQSSFNRNQTNGLAYSMSWLRGKHNMAFGGDFRRREFNYLSQQDPRGSFTFTGAATGSDFGDFLLGTPTALSIAFGNPDKYFRQSLYDAYFADDFRLRSSLTLNVGLRWGYAAPFTELHDRLVNLDIAPGFTAAAPVVASSPAGAITGKQYPDSLVRPDKLGVQPRIGIAWHPFAGHSMVVRAGYGIYEDTSVYQTIALAMAQQPPLSRTLSLQGTAANALTMAGGFTAPTSLSKNTYAIDPKFRVGNAQNWNLSVQQNLPAAFQMTATYSGIKGTHAVQASLPNTFPVGAANPCPACPLGFVYLSSGGNSTREAAQLQLRRRLRSGLAGSLTYTFSESTDDAAALGGPGGGNQNPAANSSSSTPPGIPSLAIAQDWRNLRAERGLSSFDQRHVLSAQMQYTTGMGLGGGGLMTGKTGALFSDWTVSTQLSAASGTPQTPLYLVPVPGTAFAGSLRPDYTGADITAAPAGLFLNPAAFTPPAAGRFGDARRGSIPGPSQFMFSASLARTFKLKGRYSLDLRVDANNALNRVSYRNWNTNIASPQFGVPAAANAMRMLQTTLRMRF
jgi:trimeric autotransporter adhesin